MVAARGVRLVNPVNKFLDYKGKEGLGYFTYYDSVNKENARMSFTKFIIIDYGYSIKGGTGRGENYTGYFSNEVKELHHSIKVMESGNTSNIIAEGKYADIKDIIVSAGCALHLCVTVLDCNTNELVEFFVKGKNFYDFSTNIKKVVEGIQDWDNGTLPVVEFTGSELIQGDLFNYMAPSFVVTNDLCTTQQYDLINKYADSIDEYYANLRKTYPSEVNETPEEKDSFDLAAEQLNQDSNAVPVEIPVATPINNPANNPVNSEKPLNPAQQIAQGIQPTNDISIEDVPY